MCSTRFAIVSLACSGVFMNGWSRWIVGTMTTLFGAPMAMLGAFEFSHPCLLVTGHSGALSQLALPEAREVTDQLVWAPDIRNVLSKEWLEPLLVSCLILDIHGSSVASVYTGEHFSIETVFTATASSHMIHVLIHLLRELIAANCSVYLLSTCSYTASSQF